MVYVYSQLGRDSTFTCYVIMALLFLINSTLNRTILQLPMHLLPTRSRTDMPTLLHVSWSNCYVPDTNHTKGHWMKMSLGSFSDDHSRVLLEETYDNPGSDYINANFISVSNTNNASELNPLHCMKMVSYCVWDLIFTMLPYFHWQGYKEPRAFIAAQGTVCKSSNDCVDIKHL